MIAPPAAASTTATDPAASAQASDFWPAKGGSCPAVVLTPAERRVLALVQQGLSNKEIASALNRAEPTVKNQIAVCLKKFGVPSRHRLIVLLH